MKKIFVFSIFILFAWTLVSTVEAKTNAMATVVAAKKIGPKSIVPIVEPIIAEYDVYVGGAHLIEAEVLFDEGDGKYRTRARVKTHGFWHRILPWDATLESQGKITYDSFSPAEYFDNDEWNHKLKVTKLHFDTKGHVTPEFEPPNGDENREIVTDEQKTGTFDPITALMKMMEHVQAQKNCEVTVPVFDGKRRFDVTGKNGGTEYVDEDEYGIFKGDAHVCTAEFTMIAGEWKDRKPSKFWQKSETEAGRDPFKVYFAPVGPEGNEMPIRLESTSIFGLIMVHLTKWHPASPEDLN